MGDNFLAQQCNYLLKRQKSTAKQLNMRSLCERPEILKTIFTANLAHPEGIKQGSKVRAHLMTGSNDVELVAGHLRIGTIEGEGAGTLRTILEKPGCAGVADLTVIDDASELSGCAKLKLVEGNEDEK